MKWFRGLLLAALTVSLCSCASRFVTVAPEPPSEYISLGQAEGSSCGSLGILSTAYYVIPMGLNGRVERAYSAALASVPGATGLIDVQYKEDWYWWVIGTARCVTITGEAIK